LAVSLPDKNHIHLGGINKNNESLYNSDQEIFDKISKDTLDELKEIPGKVYRYPSLKGVEDKDNLSKNK